jgi:hypothetical protein
MKKDLLSKLFNFVIVTSKIFNIDESHSLKHSMDVYLYANKIYESELPLNPYLKEQKNIIDISAILHDMCDKKYMDEIFGINRIEDFLKNDINYNINYDINTKMNVLNQNIDSNNLLDILYNKNVYNNNLILNDLEIKIIKEIILTMSYSKVKKNGYPKLNEYQLAYDIVREADLLTSYDFERCVIYNIYKNNENYENSFKDALNVFKNRVFTYENDNLFKTKYSINESKRLNIDSINKINFLKKINKIF